jgi:phage protein, HK97 gp10 family
MPLKSLVSLKGLDEYLERVAQAGENIESATAKAVDAGASVFQEGMLARAPEKTGELKRHLVKIGPDKDGNYISVKVGAFNVQRNTKGSSYIFYQEMGSAHNPPHPFIRPAFDEDKRKANAVMKEVLKEEGAL